MWPHEGALTGPAALVLRSLTDSHYPAHNVRCCKQVLAPGTQLEIAFGEHLSSRAEFADSGGPISNLSPIRSDKP